jgi:hypothetical protein
MTNEVARNDGCAPTGALGAVVLGMPLRAGQRQETSETAAGRPARELQATGPALAGLTYAEVETSRYCNRTCAWCPNGHSGARRDQQLMPWPLLEKVAAELADARFAGFIALHNYNEPLANPRLHEELGLLRAVAPQARPAIYTNGDLLRREVLERLLAAGVKYVRVTRYPHRASVAPTADALFRWLTQAGLRDAFGWRVGPVRQGLAARWQDDAAGVTVEVIARRSAPTTTAAEPRACPAHRSPASPPAR